MNGVVQELSAGTSRTSDLMRAMVEGDGYAIRSIPFNEDIDSPDELAAVARALIAKAKGRKAQGDGILPANGFRPIFEHAIVCERGYPINFAMSEDVGRVATRFQAKIPRPVQPASNKTLVDDSPESRLIRFCEQIVDKELNTGSDVRYVISEVNIIASAPDSREQPRHHDFQAYSDSELIRKPNASFMIPIDERGTLCGYPGSHKLVHAENYLANRHIPVAKRYSKIRKMLDGVIDMNKMEKRELYFGTDEYCSFVDNFLHTGAANRMRIAISRIHFYVVREDSVPPTEYTHMPSELVWDVTSKGVTSESIYERDERVEDEMEDEVGKGKKRGRPRKGD